MDKRGGGGVRGGQRHLASFTLLSRLPAREVGGAWLSSCAPQPLFGISLCVRRKKKKSYILAWEIRGARGGLPWTA